MYPRTSYTILAIALIALCLTSGACSSGKYGVITRERVSAFLNKMDEAAQRRDLDTILAHVSRKAQFKVTIEGFGPTQNLSFNRDQYADYARQVFAVVQAYEYKRGETVINIDPDGQTAYVADETFENATIQGNVIRTVSRGTAVLVLEDGELKITFSQSVGRPIQASSAPRMTSFR
jgi:hypothetical protein